VAARHPPRVGARAIATIGQNAAASRHGAPAIVGLGVQTLAGIARGRLRDLS
jgi:hypothetical protein